MFRRKQAVWWVGVLFGAVILLVHHFAFTGFYGYDDLQYAELAARMAEGHPDWSDHFSFRWGVTALVALSYKLLGVNDLASSLPALLMALATLALILGTLRHRSPWIMAGAAALFTLNHWSLFYADKLMPDVTVAFFVTAAILIYYKIFHAPGVTGKISASPPLSARANRQELLYGAALALLLLGAFLSKETVMLMVPLLAWWAVRDLITRRRVRFWGAALLTGSLLLAGYFLLTGLLAGHPAARWQALLDNRYVSFCDYASQPIRQLLLRITTGLLTDLSHQGMMAGVILTLPVLFLWRRQNNNINKNDTRTNNSTNNCNDNHTNDSNTNCTNEGNTNRTNDSITNGNTHGTNNTPALRFFSTTAGILLLSANFMTITPWAYNPMCLDPRHYLFLIPVFAISGALSLESFFRNRTYWTITLTLTLLLALLIVPLKSKNLYEQLLPLAGVAMLMLLLLFFRRKNEVSNSQQEIDSSSSSTPRWLLPLVILLLMAVMAVKPLRFAGYAHRVDYAGQKAFVMQNILTYDFDKVITDDVQKRLIRYYQGFRAVSPEPLNWEEATLLPDDDTVRIALLTNPYTAYLSGERPGRDPWFATHPQQVAVKSAGHEKLNISLYTTRGWHQPRILATSSHHYEREDPRWNGGRVILREEDSSQNSDVGPLASGTWCDHPEEYSATFRIPVDSLDLPADGVLLVTCRLHVRTTAPTGAVVVVSVPGKEKEIWQGFPVFPQVRAFDVWSPVTVHALTEAREMAPEAALTVYLWNLKNEDIYIDDWEIILAAIQSPTSAVE